MGAIIDFPNKVIISVATDIMRDKYCNKLLYYSDVSNKDIYDDSECEELNNPIEQLKNNKVFINRQITKIFDKSDIGIYVTLYRYQPYSKDSHSISKYVKQVQVEIGVICADGSRDCLNGQRDIAIISRIVDLFCDPLNKDKVNYNGIGGYSLYQVLPLYNMPSGFTGYQIILNIESHKK